MPYIVAAMKEKLASLACIFMALAVACGAFGAHALRDSLSPHDLATWQTAVLYQLIHSLAAFVITIVQREERALLRVSSLLLVSTVVFSGSLYLLVLLNQRWLGAVTPIGGVGFILSWLLLARILLKPGSTNRLKP